MKPDCIVEETLLLRKVGEHSTPTLELRLPSATPKYKERGIDTFRLLLLFVRPDFVLSLPPWIFSAVDVPRGFPTGKPSSTMKPALVTTATATPASCALWPSSPRRRLSFTWKYSVTMNTNARPAVSTSVRNLTSRWYVISLFAARAGDCR